MTGISTNLLNQPVWQQMTKLWQCWQAEAFGGHFPFLRAQANWYSPPNKYQRHSIAPPLN